MTSPIHNEAADKIAIAEALYRYAAGIDLKNNALIASAFTKDAESDFGPASRKAGFDFPILVGRDNIITVVSGALSKIDTTHSVSNPRVTVSNNSAHLEAMVEAQHVPKDDPARHFLMKNRYDVELVRQGDVWLMTRITVDNVWRTGDPTVLTGK